jgi:drug/metabolite transporter (DMT)-like permease
MSQTAVLQRPQPNPLVALAWMSLALAAFTIVAIAGREAAKSISTPQMMMWRGFFSLALILLVGLATGRLIGALRTRVLHLHAFRNTIHFGAQFAWLHALTLIPLAELFALEFTTPLWIAILAPLLISERLTSWRLGAAIVGFVGTLIVVLMPESARVSGFTISPGTALALLSAVGFAFSMMTTKRLTQTENVFTILLYMAIMQAGFSSLLALQSFVVPSPEVLGWLLLLAACGLAAHYGIAQAFARADAIVVAPMDFLRLPLIALVGAQLYGEILDPWVVAGGIVVIAANAINIWGERRSASRVAPRVASGVSLRA